MRSSAGPQGLLPVRIYNEGSGVAPTPVAEDSKNPS